MPHNEEQAQSAPSGLQALKADRSLLERVVRQAGGSIQGDSVNCPFHDDNNPSGSIHQTDGDGAWLYTCHACKWNNGQRTGDAIAVIQNADKIEFGAACEHLHYLGAEPSRESTIVDREGLIKLVVSSGKSLKSQGINLWPYLDSEGNPIMVVARFDGAEGKTYRPLHLIGSAWRTGDPSGPLPLYQLSELGDDDSTIYVVEGEKCADAARNLGLRATTSAHGCKAANKTDWSPLAGRKVVILPDNDVPGQLYARDVGQLLLSLDPPARVRIVELPGLPEGGDLVEFLEANESTPASELGQRIERLSDEAPELELADLDNLNSVPDSVLPRDGNGGMESKTATCKRVPIFPVVPIGEFLSHPDEETPWVVDQLLPAHGLSVLTAQPKVGKSTLIRSLLMCVARGDTFLGRQTLQGPVVYLCLEDIEGQVRKSFRMLGATEEDPILIHVGPAPSGKPATGLRELFSAYDPVLVVIDTLGICIRCKDLNDYAVVIKDLKPIIDVIRDSNRGHVLFTHHAPKKSSGGGADALGSTAIFGSVDTLVNMHIDSGQVIAYADMQRYGAHLPRTVLSIDLESGFVSGLETIAPSPGEIEQAKEEKKRKGIRAMLTVGEPGRTWCDLKAGGIGRHEDLRKLLDEMEAEGEVAWSGSGKKNDPRRYWLVPDADAESDTVPRSVPLEELQREPHREPTKVSPAQRCSDDAGPLDVRPSRPESVRAAKPNPCGADDSGEQG